MTDFVTRLTLKVGIGCACNTAPQSDANWLPCGVAMQPPSPCHKGKCYLILRDMPSAILGQGNLAGAGAATDARGAT